MKINTQCRYLFLLVFVSVSMSIKAQIKSGFWYQTSDVLNSDYEKWDRVSMPDTYTVYGLNIDDLFAKIESAPNRTLSDNTNGIVVSFPSLDGLYEDYEIFDAPVLSEELQIELSDVRSFVGTSLKNKGKTIRFSISLFGLKAIIFDSDNSVQYIDSLTKDRKFYIAYSKSDIPLSESQISCLTEDSQDQISSSLDEGINSAARNANDGKLRNFRLALSCTQEYATYHVNQAGLNTASDAIKKNAILAVMNDVMTRVNAVYERELAVTMTIVDNNRNVIFITDSFLTNDDISELINESQFYIDAFIGEPYDIGHMLSTSGSGLAQLFSPCTNNKARAVSSSLSGPPTGYGFESTLMHEMGHQYGAYHTYNSNTCAGPSTSSTAYEPGGGTTIMSYAGICGSTSNIQSQADLYFHQASLTEMWSNINFGNSTCAEQLSIANSSPTSNAGNDYTIPFRTPYKLVGSATDDKDVDFLTYCWEEYDLGVTSAAPSDFTADGPVVRSYSPSANNVRYIPRLEDYVGNVNTSSDWERLMLVERDLNFRLTVRDNDIQGGQTSVDEMNISLTNSAGPFVVTSQNTFNTVYVGNSSQEVAWNVALTNTGVVNTQNVNILLSTDGGLTFDTVLLSNTPNDGSEMVTLPNIDASSCRIMVEAVGNIFYNINRRDFEIEQSLGVDDFGFDSNLSIHPNPNKGEFTISFDSRVNNNDDVKVDVYDISGRLVYKNSFSNNSVRFSETVNLRGVASGVYITNISQGNNVTSKKVIIE
ncbi:zinc-dependent metalloprotease [Winogradskyella undariae]|uniref:zinc-dependent metalloprotease n=1 Tax=Winogradskyella undariae TaxID=1285465 RepID=UPI0015C6DFC2|nr:zinc-dependent metalloprotease [Winogradskyella undariae]